MWEYLVAHYSIAVNLTEITNILNLYGGDRWELIDIIEDNTITDKKSYPYDNKIFFFKRPKL